MDASPAVLIYADLELRKLIQVVGWIAIGIAADVHFAVSAFKNIHTGNGTGLNLVQSLLVIKHPSGRGLEADQVSVTVTLGGYKPFTCTVHHLGSTPSRLDWP
ncbi:hypothetical protein D3C74_439870 [compost metagenome]